MRLEGLHHITAITGDAPRNVDFYTGTLGLRMVARQHPRPVAVARIDAADREHAGAEQQRAERQERPRADAPRREASATGPATGTAAATAAARRRRPPSGP